MGLAGNPGQPPCIHSPTPTPLARSLKVPGSLSLAEMPASCLLDSAGRSHAGCLSSVVSVRATPLPLPRQATEPRPFSSMILDSIHMSRHGSCFLVSHLLWKCQEGDGWSGRNGFMVKNEQRLHLLQEGGRHHLRSPRQMDENSAYEVTAPLLIRGEGALPCCIGPHQWPKACQHFPRRMKM